MSAHKGDDELLVSPSCCLFGKLKSVDDGIDERLQAEEGAPRNMSVLKGERAQLAKNGLGNQGEVAATPIVKTGKEALTINNIGIQPGGREEDENGIAICTSTSYFKTPTTPANEELVVVGVLPETSEPESAPPPVLPCYSVGKGISLPFSQVLPQCSECNSSALIVRSSRSDAKENGVVCLDHGLTRHTDVRRLAMIWSIERRYRFISPDHEAAIRAFLT